jgi:hypothetical protein
LILLSSSRNFLLLWNLKDQNYKTYYYITYGYICWERDKRQRKMELTHFKNEQRQDGLNIVREASETAPT